MNAEIMVLEKRNLELEEEVGMLKSSSELLASELQSEVKKGTDEIVVLKSQLEETINAADKCIEELEEQVRKYEDDKATVRSSADKRVMDLEDVLRKVRDDKAVVEGRLGDAELEVKRQKEEVATQVARNNYTRRRGTTAWPSWTTSSG